MVRIWLSFSWRVADTECLTEMEAEKVKNNKKWQVMFYLRLTHLVWLVKNTERVLCFVCSLCCEQTEDLSDDVFAQRHLPMEQKEKLRWSSWGKRTCCRRPSRWIHMHTNWLAQMHSKKSLMFPSVILTSTNMWWCFPYFETAAAAWKLLLFISLSDSRVLWNILIDFQYFFFFQICQQAVRQRGQDVHIRRGELCGVELCSAGFWWADRVRGVAGKIKILQMKHKTNLRMWH